MAESDDDTKTGFETDEEPEASLGSTQKRRHPELKAVVNKLPEGFHCNTTNVKKFCSMLRCLGTKDMMDVCFHFSELGMTLYSRGSVWPVIVKAFWHKLFFQSYACPQTFDVWVDPKSLVELNKRIKDVESIDIKTLCSVSTSGLTVTGAKKSSNGHSRKFYVNLPESNSSHDFLKLDQKYVWSIQTPAHTFNDNVCFISTTAAFLKMGYSSSQLSFHAVSDSGLLSSGIEQDAEASAEIVDHNFENLFQPKLLKLVAQPHDLATMLDISYPLQEPEKVALVRFSYYLDSETPQSHFSVFVNEAGANEA
jgi:hypothetical protein